jgi:transposase-like protein
MRQRELVRLLKSLGQLTHVQRQKVMAELGTGERQAASVAIVEGSVSVKPNCPHCGGEHVVRNGVAHDLQRYKCRDCRKSFNALTGTPLAQLRMKGKWLGQTAVLRDGVTITEAAETLGVARSTAFRWRHRFLALPKTIQAKSFVGIAETDETYFLQSFKGLRKGLTRQARKRGGSAAKRGTSKEQIPVLVTRDRAGSTADAILPADDKASVVAALGPLLPKDIILCSDGSSTLAAAAKALGAAHRPIKLSAGIRVVAGVYHVQNVNAYDSRLKDWIRRFHGVATRYLDSYLGWFRAIDRTRGAGLNPASLLASAVRI